MKTVIRFVTRNEELMREELSRLDPIRRADRIAHYVKRGGPAANRAINAAIHLDTVGVGTAAPRNKRVKHVPSFK